MGGIKTFKSSSRTRNQLLASPVVSGAEELRAKSSSKGRRSGRSSRKGRVHPDHRSSSRAMDGEESRRSSKLSLTVHTVCDDEQRQASHSHDGVRGSRDWRSPGAQKTPLAQVARHANDDQVLPDFITQTDANGNATTPRSAAAINGARKAKQFGEKPPPGDRRGRRRSNRDNDDDDGVHDGSEVFSPDDPCDTLLESFRMMCCCLMEDGKPGRTLAGMPETEERPRLLGPIHPDDQGKKCLVLDLDETLVHSSFRAVPGSDFVIPVQIEDVVHFVYVAKRPGVDEFLVEMAKHYEIVIYTASLNKYADPLLDLLDPQKTIRYRLFRESCVYYEGNYVKDLSLLNRDISQTIIIDNSPNSYLFHPENAIDCSSFIDDKRDRELDQIGSFLKGTKDAKDVRGLSPEWRRWPNIDFEANRR